VGFGGWTGPGETDLAPELHEARAMAARKTRTKRNRGRSAEDIVRIVSAGEKGRGNWTEGQKWNSGGKDWPRRHRGCGGKKVASDERREERRKRGCTKEETESM